MAHIVTPPVTIAVDDNKTYAITIEYGNGVMTGSSAFFDFNDNVQQGQITAVPLGTGKEIKGQTLHVVSTLPADNKNATFVSVIFEINGSSVSRRAQITGDKIYTLETDINFN